VSREPWLRRPFLALFFVVALSGYIVAVFFLTANKPLLWSLGLRKPFEVRDFSLDEVRGGAPFRLDEHHGRPVVLVVFSTLSPDLGQFLEAAAAVSEAHEGRHAVLAAVNYQELDRAALLEFLERGEYDFPVYDGFTDLFPLYSLCAKVPKIFVLDRRRRLITELDRPDADALDAALKAAAEDGSPEAALPLERVQQPLPEDGPPAWARLGAEAEALLAEAKYDELEQRARELRAPDARFPDGLPRLAALYDGLAGERWLRQRFDGDSPFPKRVQALEAWLAARPESAAAHVALSKALIYWGWRARGAGSVDEEPKEFKERLRRAWDLAQAARALPDKDAEAWRALLGAGTALQKETAELEALFQQALAEEPAQERLHQARASYLSPRWFGEPGQWEAYAEKAAAERGEPGLYALIAESQADYYGESLFQETKLAWPKLLAGLRDLDRRHPDSLYRLNLFARFSCLAGDKAVTREVFGRLGLRFRRDVWRERERFDRCYDWAHDRAREQRVAPDLDLARLAQRLRKP
jgi:hypothetical protein